MKLQPRNYNLKTIFMGTPEIGARILQALIDAGYQINSVVTRMDKPKGRHGEPEKSPVKILAEKHHLKLFQPKNKLELEEYVISQKPDLIVVTAFGMIITGPTLDAAKLGAINVHPSLLPLYRGPAPISGPILAGDKKTGTTIMLMNEKMDEGDILAQKEYPLTGQETTPNLTETLAKISADFLLPTLPKYLAGQIKPQKQDDAAATYTKMVKKEDGHLNFENQTAADIEKMSRAYTPWPGVYAFWNGKKLSLFDISTANLPLSPAKVTTHGDEILIGTKEGVIIPHFLQLEGKNKIAAAEFLRGYSSIKSSILTN